MGRRKKNSRKPVTTEVKDSSGKKGEEKDGGSEKTSDCEEKGQPRIPIDIFARLTFPLVNVDPDDDLEDESDDEDRLEINFRPRLTFVSSLCLVCMKKSKMICEWCGMVSYCSEKHKEQGWPTHRHLCNVIAEICARENGMALAKDLSAEQYRVYRLKLIEMIEAAAQRPLELWEREIMLYPRVCRTCREFFAKSTPCPGCQVEFFCENHRLAHESCCREFQVFRRVLRAQRKFGHVQPRFPFAPRSYPLALPDDLDLLVAQLYGYSEYYRAMDCHTYATLSHISTAPLTALYSAQKSCRDWRGKDSCVVHVVGAEFQFECTNLRAWESMFLHLLPNLRKLSLVFVGPELRLPPVPLKFLAKVKLCSRCKSSGSSIKLDFRQRQFYHDYASSSGFVRPDLVCLFNPGLYRHTAFEGIDSWPETIRQFCALGVPVAVTSYTQHEIPREIDRISSISRVEVLLKPQRNPFASLKPDRNFVSDDTAPLIYKNYFITIVKGK